MLICSSTHTYQQQTHSSINGRTCVIHMPDACPVHVHVHVHVGMDNVYVRTHMYMDTWTYVHVHRCWSTRAP